MLQEVSIKTALEFTTISCLVQMLGGSGKDWVPALPSEVLHRVTAHLAGKEVSKASAVNSAWLEAFGRTMLELHPKGSLHHAVRLAERFPELQSLSMHDCVGVDVTDEQVLEAARLRYLKRLSLEGCRNCTDAAIAALASLPGGSSCMRNIVWFNYTSSLPVLLAEIGYRTPSSQLLQEGNWLSVLQLESETRTI